MNLVSLIQRLPLGGHPVERLYRLYRTMPAPVFRHMQSESFKGTVRYAAEKSPFYRREFQKRGIDPSRILEPRDFGDFYTTAEDIRRNPDDFLCAPAETAYESTGTTSKKTKRVYFSRDEVREAGLAGAVGLWGLGVRPQDRVSSAFDYSFWVSGPVLVASCEHLGCFHVEAGRLAPDEFYERLADYRLSVLVGDPSWLLAFSEVAAKRGVWKGVKLLIGGGENFTEAARRHVEDIWKADFILSYGQTEAFGALAMEPLDKRGLLLNDFHNRFEIVERDPDGWGELVYTTVNRRVMPLIRYRSGDLTRFEPGQDQRRISKLRGRVDEWVPTAMGNITPWMMEPVFQEAGFCGDWQVAVEKDASNVKDVIKLLAEAPSSGPGAENLLAAFRQQFAEAWKLSQGGLFEVRAEALPPGTLKTGRKLKRIDDRRKF